MKFDDKFVADMRLGCILWAETADEPKPKRIRFSIDESILMDELGLGNPVHHEENVACCEKHRPRVEAACRSAFAARPGATVELQSIDFREEAQA